MSKPDHSDSINTLLARLSIAVRVANEKLMCEVGLHAGQAQVLISLWEADALSQAELVKRLGIAAPTVNKMVRKLKEDDFIEMRRCPEDRRLMKVSLTAKGKSIQPEVESQLCRFEETVYGDFTDTERLLLPILLGKVRTNLELLISDNSE